jgi:aryl-alcohol dehydrogenase-like predicted oxidoreductase
MQCKVSTLDIVSMSLIQSADYAIANKLTPFISMQNHYNLIYREEEREMFPTLKVCRVLN